MIRSKLRARGITHSVTDVIRKLAQIKYHELTINNESVTAITDKTEEQLSLIQLFELDKLKNVGE